jgi:hypothetical protein
MRIPRKIHTANFCAGAVPPGNPNRNGRCPIRRGFRFSNFFIFPIRFCRPHYDISLRQQLFHYVAMHIG